MTATIQTIYNVCEIFLCRLDMDTISCAALWSSFNHRKSQSWPQRDQILETDLPLRSFQIHQEGATPAPLTAITPPAVRALRSTCVLNYHTNRPWDCLVSKPSLPTPSDWPEALKQMGGWLSLQWTHFSQRCLYQLLVLCVCDCTLSL